MLFAVALFVYLAKYDTNIKVLNPKILQVLLSYWKLIIFTSSTAIGCCCYLLAFSFIGKSFALEHFPYVFAWNKASTVPLFITTLESPFVAKWIRIIWSDTHSFNVTNKTFHLTASWISFLSFEAGAAVIIGNIGA